MICAADFDTELVRPNAERLGEGERGGLGTGVERDVGASRSVVDGDGSERGVDGVERQPRGGRTHLDVDDFHAGSARLVMSGLSSIA